MTIYNFQSKIRNPSATLRTGPKSAIALTLLLVLTSGLVAPHPALAATLTVNTLLDENDGSCADGDCSLRDAIQVAAPGDTIIFGITGTIILTLGQLTVDKDLTLSGPGQDSLTLSGNNTSRIFWITAGNVAFSGLTIANGYADNGGGMYNSISNPTLTEVTFNGNFATSSGGGIYNIGSHPTLNNVTFNSNSATYGGGMYNNWSSPKLMNVTFSGNPASGHGGGMYNEDYSNPTLTNVTFSGNSASDSGGGMYNMSSSPTLTNVTFSSNLALYGGGMFNVYGNPTLTNVTFSGNSAYFDGGGMYSYGNNSALTDVTFSGNLATHGGGMYNYLCFR
jgi:CSLREA domain-containing protein